MYVDKIPNEYVVSKFCTSITNISCKNKIIYQKEHQFITYLQQPGIIVGGIPSQVDCLQSLKERDARTTLKKNNFGFFKIVSRDGYGWKSATGAK